jgi:hypothetical protein
MPECLGEVLILVLHLAVTPDLQRRVAAASSLRDGSCGGSSMRQVTSPVVLFMVDGRRIMRAWSASPAGLGRDFGTVTSNVRPDWSRCDRSRAAPPTGGR